MRRLWAWINAAPAAAAATAAAAAATAAAAAAADATPAATAPSPTSPAAPTHPTTPTPTPPPILLPSSACCYRCNLCHSLLPPLLTYTYYRHRPCRGAAGAATASRVGPGPAWRGPARRSSRAQVRKAGRGKCRAGPGPGLAGQGPPPPPRQPLLSSPPSSPPSSPWRLLDEVSCLHGIIIIIVIIIITIILILIIMVIVIVSTLTLGGGVERLLEQVCDLRGILRLAAAAATTTTTSIRSIISICSIYRRAPARGSLQSPWPPAR